MTNRPDISISSSENEDEENVDYKLKIPIPTATLLEKYQDCDSDDSWETPSFNCSIAQMTFYDIEKVSGELFTRVL